MPLSRLRPLCACLLSRSKFLSPLAAITLVLIGAWLSGCGSKGAPKVTTLAVTLANAQINSTGTDQATATATYSDKHTADVTSTVTWSSSTSSVATVSATGLISGVMKGQTTITATLKAVTATAALTVNPTLKSIAVLPGGASIKVTGTQQYTATGTYDDASTSDITATVTWSTSDVTHATISSPGGLLTGVKTGPITISAALSGITGNAMATVVPTLKSIAVTPPAASIKVGATQQYTATGTYDDASTADLSAMVAWSTSDATHATITAAGGLLTGVGIGPVTIAAALSGVTGTTTATITAATVAIHNRVVDQTGVGLNNIQLVFSTGSAPAVTDPHGNFTAAAVPGSNTLTITNSGQPVLTTSVTVNPDGSIVEYPTKIQVTVPLGVPNETKTPFVGARALLYVTPTVPFSGQSVVVAFSDANSTATSVQFTGVGCGALTSGQLNGTSYSQTAQVANAGSCQIVATVQYPAGPQTFKSVFQVRPTSVTLPALNIVGGDFVPGDSLTPAVNFTGALAVTGVSGPGKLINGAVARIYVQTTNTATTAGIVSIQVGVHGRAGYFTVPAKLAAGKLYFDIALDQDYFTRPATANAMTRDIRLTRRGRSGALDATTPTDISLDVQTVDSQGNTSDPFVSTFSLTQVGTGTLQISLSWGTVDDLDLHVVEPNGNEIYYGVPSSADGGVLDLDSNGGCHIDNIDTENVTWPLTTPPAGKYIVRADYWASCTDVPDNPAYQVTVNNCGNVAQFTGSFDASQQDGLGAGAGTTVSTFDFTPCNAAEVSGTATYDDLAQTPTGLSTTPVEVPIRYATAEVRRASDETVLTTGETDAAGKFDLFFTNTGTPGYYVKIVALGTSHVLQEVQDDAGKDWEIKSQIYDETMTHNNTGVMIHALTSDVAPAFNVYNIGVDGAASVKRWFHAEPTKITWIYFDMQAPPPCPNVSCFTGDDDTIFVNGGPPNAAGVRDPDVYDDLVLLHEYGHFVQKYFSGTHSPGGSHNLAQQFDPRLAWGEGNATFFALFTRQTSEYIDTTSAGIGLRYDVSLPLADATIPRGTDDNTQTGYLNEVLPTAGMWAMAVTDLNPIGTFNAMGAVKRVTASSESDRDFSGADFVDYLDGWFCTGNDLNLLLRPEINFLLKFPYDYAPLNVPGFCTAVFPDAIIGVQPSAEPLVAHPPVRPYTGPPKKKR